MGASGDVTDKTKITIKTDITKIPKGHTPHKSGAGPHKSKKDKGTRAEKNRKAIDEDRE